MPEPELEEDEPCDIPEDDDSEGSDATDSDDVEDLAKQIGADKTNRELLKLITHLVEVATKPREVGTARSELGPAADQAIDDYVQAACQRGRRIFDLDREGKWDR
jgi:hypothetical protein